MINLKVLIVGRHHLHGYKAMICDIAQVGERGPESFRVEVEATHKLETVNKTNLTIQMWVPLMIVFVTLKFQL